MDLSLVLLLAALWLIIPHCFDRLNSQPWLLPVQLAVILLALIAYTASVPEHDNNHIGLPGWVALLAAGYIYYLATKGK